MPGVQDVLQSRVESLCVELHGGHSFASSFRCRASDVVVVRGQEVCCSAFAVASLKARRSHFRHVTHFVKHARHSYSKHLALTPFTMNEDCRIYTDYSITLPPEHPGEDWTRFVCISDTHSKTNLGIPPGDVLLHGGDLSSRATYGDLHETIDWLASLPHELKMYVRPPGNVPSLTPLLQNHCWQPRRK